MINASLNSRVNAVFRIEFFANTTCDPSGNGQGEVYLGSTTVFTDDSGNANFTFNITTPVSNKPSVTATATDSAGNTSEFSLCQTAPACTYGIGPTTASFTASGGSGSVGVTVGAGCAWTATSNDPTWLSITSGSSGSGNGSVGYSVAANGTATPRTGTLTVAGQTFTVSQAAASAIVVGDFNAGIPSDWQVVDNGSPAFYNNDTSQPLTWTTANPCGETIPSPFVAPFAIVDGSCTAPSVALDEELRLPPFNATGLGSVFVEFYSQFVWDASAPNTGDVDVSNDGGLTWTNALRLQNASDGFPTPALKSIDITPYITNPANVLVRLHYYGMSPPPSFQPSFRSAITASTTSGVRVYWGVDFGAYSYTLTPTSQSFAAGGGTGTITVAASTAIPSPQGQWMAVSNASWITINSGAGPTIGNGTVTYTVAANTGLARTGTMTVSGRTFTVTQAGGGSGGCPTITIVPPSLSDGVVGKSYSQNVNASPGGSYRYTVTSGALPQGLSLDAATGKLTGTPKKAGTFNVTIRATAGTCFGSRAYAIRIK